MDIMVFSLRSECFVSRKKFEIRTFKMADVTISEDRLKTLMKEIFKEEFEKQQKNLLNLISWNFDITMTEIKKVQSDINELKASLEHTETVLEEKVAKAEKKIEKLKEQINELWDYQVDPERLEVTERKIVDLEDRSRRNNLRIDGISEKENETWDECGQEVQSLIKDKLGIAENIVIERARRIKKTGNSDNPRKPRTIVCRFLNYKDKTNILKNAKKLKGKNIFINEDFSHETMELSQELCEKVKERRDEGEIAYFHYRTVVVKRRNNQGLS